MRQTDIQKEGILLYDSGRHRLAEARPGTLDERRRYAQMSFDNFFTTATQFFSFALEGIKKDWNRISAFQLHQAVEHYYKCVVLVLTFYLPKEHNIEKLGIKCAGLHSAFRDIFPRGDRASRQRFQLLKDAYVKGRFSMHYSITREQLEELARNVAVLHERTEAVCKEHIASMPAEPAPS